MAIYSEVVRAFCNSFFDSKIEIPPSILEQYRVKVEGFCLDVSEERVLAPIWMINDWGDQWDELNPLGARAIDKRDLFVVENIAEFLQERNLEIPPDIARFLISAWFNL